MPMTINQFKIFKKIIESKLGFHFPDNKKSILQSKLLRRMNIIGVSEFNDYVKLLINKHPDSEINKFINLITINKTSFYREKRQLEYFIKYLTNDSSSQKFTRRHAIWSAGCSSGQEPYSLATEILYSISKFKIHIDFSIIGTDINTEMIKCCKRALYALSQSKNIPIDRRSKFLLKAKHNDKEYFTFNDDVKSKIDFRVANLIDLDRNPVGEFDCIFCCNVLIYFNKDIQNTILRNFSRNLKPNGQLIIGLSESLPNNQKVFLKTEPGVYKRK